MIDVLIATYNGELYLKQQLDSILNQSFQDFRIIISDDNSTDNTLKIIKEYCENYKDKIFLITDKKTLKGAKNNFFKLLNYSDSKYIMFCDQDDVWKKDKIKNTYKAILSLEKLYKNKPICVYTDLIVVNENLKIIANSFMNYQNLYKKVPDINKILVQNNATGCTMIFNKKVKEFLIESFNQKILMHDYWVLLLCKVFGKAYYLNEKTILYRQHSFNTVGAKKQNIFYFLKNINKVKYAAKSLNDVINQAEFFYEIYNNKMDIKNKKIFLNFINLKKQSKFLRIYTCIKFDYLKKGFLRKLGQFFTLLFI